MRHCIQTKLSFHTEGCFSSVCSVQDLVNFHVHQHYLNDYPILGIEFYLGILGTKNALKRNKIQKIKLS